MSRQKLKISLRGLLVVACLSLLLWTRPSVSTVEAATSTPGSNDAATMPKQCHPGKTSTQALGWRWQPHAQVRVYYLASDFSAADRDALSRAVNSWNDALSQTDTHITFTVAGTRASESQENLTLTVVRGVPRGRDRVGEVKLYSLSNGAHHVTVVIGPDITTPMALTSLMTHEIGHSLGLADCYECRRGTTAMSAFKDMSKGNEVYEPSECDLYVVAEGYASETDAQARVVSNSRE